MTKFGVAYTDAVYLGNYYRNVNMDLCYKRLTTLRLRLKNKGEILICDGIYEQIYSHKI